MDHGLWVMDYGLWVMEYVLKFKHKLNLNLNKSIHFNHNNQSGILVYKHCNIFMPKVFYFSIRELTKTTQMVVFSCVDGKRKGGCQCTPTKYTFKYSNLFYFFLCIKKCVQLLESGGFYWGGLRD